VPGPAGRFQLITLGSHVLVKIDTTSGQTWVREILPEDSATGSWKPLAEKTERR
jgi:hypothetical protein